MIKVSIVGTGNLSHHLNRAVSRAEGVTITQVINSRLDSFEDVLNPLKKDGETQNPEQPDIYIVAVSDDAIFSVSEKFQKTKSLVVHTSGGVSLDTLPQELRRGVFYPLQTFSKNSKVDFSKVPICIEAENEDDLTLLNDLAHKLSKTVYEVSSEKRAHLHMAAVFVNNFTNHLYQIGAEICTSKDIPFSILEPLINETAKKVERLKPLEVQTGPAKRGDKKTIEKHLDLLNHQTQKEIYSLLSESIQETYATKL